jgi:hypothetical protein
MPAHLEHPAGERLRRLQAELADLAFALERRGRLEAADVAMTASARVEELCDELESIAGPVCDDARLRASVHDRTSAPMSRDT